MAADRWQSRYAPKAVKDLGADDLTGIDGTLQTASRACVATDDQDATLA
jgi:hypothetical protein